MLRKVPQKIAFTNCFCSHRNFLVVVLIVQVCVNLVEGREVACESVKSSEWDSPVRRAKTCFMMQSTSIDELEVTISTSHDESIGAIDFYGNKNIVYLPIKVNKNFPNLSSYDAARCSIKEISQKNLKGLGMLRVLWLHDNQIEKIMSDLFHDLVLLEELWLCKTNVGKFLLF